MPAVAAAGRQACPFAAQPQPLPAAAVQQPLSSCTDSQLGRLRPPDFGFDAQHDDGAAEAVLHVTSIDAGGDGAFASA
jgi:hypothetical protein